MRLKATTDRLQCQTLAYDPRRKSQQASISGCTITSVASIAAPGFTAASAGMVETA